ncbi:hypothetical protein H311_00025 [Anncaliia algerae PRA109]|nr:hypothetical protein H311_00025 [Anncaliia algerae PRA109]
MLRNMFVFFVVSLCKFFPTKWDPLLKQTTMNSKIKAIRGFFNEHGRKIGVDTFGDISIMTLNLYSRAELDTTEEQMTAIRGMIDHGHPGVFALQGVNEQLMKRFEEEFAKSAHYKIINYVKSSTDLLNGINYFLPIFYDGRMYEKKASGYFTYDNEDKTIKLLYGSWVRLKGLKTEFTVINMDLFSTYKEITDAQFAKFVKDIRENHLTNIFPVFFVGTINAITRNISELVANEYEDLLEMDKNNEGLSKTTMHVKKSLDDNKKRTFIILRNKFKTYELNYARILSEFDLVGNYYPVHAILTVKPKPKPQKAIPNQPKSLNDALRVLDKKTEKALVNKAVKEASGAKNRAAAAA